MGTMDIQMIRAAPFGTFVKKANYNIFMTSLHEIEWELEDQQNPAETELPAEYQTFADIFSKEVSDCLPPSHTCNHKIKLDLDTDVACAVGYSPLYKQTTEHLEAAKQYIVDNLQKGFIVPSHMPFTSPFLMA